MKLISHRGNLRGVNESRENTIEYITEALDQGYDVEVDIREENSKLYLGHDYAMEEVSIDFLKNNRIWCHCKTVPCFFRLMPHKEINCFFQNQDSVALTSRGYGWCHSDEDYLNPKAILTNLSLDEDSFRNIISNYKSTKSPHGICSDEVALMREEIDWNGYSILESSNKLSWKLLVIDIDGVLTDGTKTYDLEGKVLSKSYHDHDFTAIKRFMASGIKVCFLSGDTAVNQKMAKIRGVDYYHSRDPVTGTIDKANYLSMLISKYNVSLHEIAFIGDDYYDLSIIESLNKSNTFCPGDSISDIKEAVGTVLTSNGGQGTIKELYELVRKHLPYSYPKDDYSNNNKQK